MEFPDNLNYTEEHEWIRKDDDGSVTIGVTDYAQDQLGDIVFVELPQVNDEIVSKESPFAVVESVKAVSDIYAPLTGAVVEVNDELPNSPEVVNEDPYGDGWLIKVRISDEAGLAKLIDYAAYQKQCAEAG